MELLIDSNVVLDVLMKRSPYYEASDKVWKLCETKMTKGYVSTLSFADLVYIMRKQLNPDKTNDVLSLMKLIFEFADLCEDDIVKAAESRWNDYEDALQAATAKRIGADYIVTRNVKDFTLSEVKAVTPEELLEMFK